MTPQQQLNVMVLDFACQLAVTGQYRVLIRHGVRRDQISRLRRMTAEERHMVATSVGGIVADPKFDAVAIDQLFGCLERRRRERLLQRRLILAGAGQPMMEELYGMRARDFIEIREELEIKGEGNGRCPNPDPDAERLLWRVWNATAHIGDLAERILRVHDDTGISARLIWAFIRTLEIRGQSGISRPGQEPPRVSPRRRAGSEI